MEKIDFVILWVDGSDPVWLEEKKKYKPEIDITNEANRFRDWDNLKYWFRAVEKYAPWVNNIFFVTYGHLPKFLNTENPKLRIVNHKDIIDEKYLPTYNSSAIEMNIFKIKDLSEQFVYFNDDVFLTDYVKSTDFFVDGIPCDEFCESPITPTMDPFTNLLFNDLAIISKYYDKTATKKLLKGKYYNFKYGINNFRTLLLAPYSRFVGFYNPHYCQAFLKSYFEKAYRLETEAFENTFSHKFRHREDINQYLVRYLQLLDGNFLPRSSKFAKSYVLSSDNDSITNAIIKQRYKAICLNDNDPGIDFTKVQNEINSAFQKILPKKSSFEK